MSREKWDETHSDLGVIALEHSPVTHQLLGYVFWVMFDPLYHGKSPFRRLCLVHFSQASNKQIQVKVDILFSPTSFAVFKRSFAHLEKPPNRNSEIQRLDRLSTKTTCYV